MQDRLNRIAHALTRTTAVLAVAAALGACSGSFDIPFPALPADTPEFPGSSTSVYARVARGGNTCWFGPNGALDKTYIWHAKAEPEAKGGMAEILIHERFEKNQRGLKAFSVVIAPKGENAASVAVQNLKFPEAVGQRMMADANRWARGGIGCTQGDTTWSPVVPEVAKALNSKALNSKAPEPKTKVSKNKPDVAAATAPKTGLPKATQTSGSLAGDASDRTNAGQTQPAVAPSPGGTATKAAVPAPSP